MTSDYDEFVNKLHTEFPAMFANTYGGVAVGNGWWPIIYSLCKNIQSHINWRNEQFIKYGYGELELIPQVTVEQIKEKFGGLRFYYSGGDSTVDGMVRMAEEWAAHSCEECGAPGVRRSGGWVRTLCDMHENERQEKMSKLHDRIG